MFCSKCGVNNDPGASFCKQCGNALQTAAQQPVYQPPPAYQPPPIYNQQLGFQQPGMPMQHVDNYMTQAVLVTLFCCLPFGIVGILKASNVNKFLAMGDVRNAMQASQEAKNFTMIGFVCGLVGVGLWVLCVIIAAI